MSALAVAACFAAADASGLPLGAHVVNGTANIAQVGNVLTVTNSNGAIINWQQFNIDAGQTARFVQPSASSSVLNRVLANDPSVILGNLTSNGRVWLVNPAGIFVGQGARIDAAAFVASTLNVTNANFLANRMKFGNGAGGAGRVVNQGQITTPMGGSVYLIGSQVANEGIITTPQGETILAAGSKVELIDSATPGVKVEITGAEGDVTNLGEITAEAGRIGIAGVVVRNSGRLNASSAVEEGGRIFLRATRKIELTDSSRVGADGTAGGHITVLGTAGGQIAGELVARGEISARGGGGFVETSAGHADIGGLRVDVGGGLWLIDPFDYSIDSTAAASIAGTLDGGGSVSIDTTNSTGAGAGAAGNGDITVASAIAKTAGADATLTLNAHNNINLDASITSTAGQLNMVLNPDQDGSGGGAVVLGAVTLDANGGTINAAGKSVTHSTGTATIDSAITVGTLNLAGGTLTGTGSITVPTGGTFNWSGGTLDGTAAAAIETQAGSTTNLINSPTLGANRTWNNAGTVSWTSTGCCTGVTLSGILNNQAGGLFELNLGSFGGGMSGAGTINNAGEFRKSLNGTAVATAIAPAFNNQAGGVVNVNSSTLALNGTGADLAGSAYTIASGATLEFGASRTVAGSITGLGSGSVGFAGSGTSYGVSGSYDVSG
ncbi:MAG: filamentous hemagglutinin N-terminal domain-containing protein, partial [Rhodocyclales bacterium]|nr:filamentous hemagglutinin N-terminal domain-containing protein [Rhodocyclales bacterium]